MDTKRLRDLREDNDKTQQQIADMLNMHRSVYRRYESGEREIPVWAVIKLADYYRVSTDYLLGVCGGRCALAVFTERAVGARFMRHFCRGGAYHGALRLRK